MSKEISLIIGRGYLTTKILSLILSLSRAIMSLSLTNVVPNSLSNTKRVSKHYTRFFQFLSLPNARKFGMIVWIRFFAGRTSVNSWNDLKIAILTSVQSSRSIDTKNPRMWSLDAFLPSTGAKDNTLLAREARKC